MLTLNDAKSIVAACDDANVPSTSRQFLLFDKTIPPYVLPGLRDIQVKCIDYPHNPYRSIVEGALMTFYNGQEKWPRMSPKSRFEVFNEVAQFRALPNAMEAPKYTFLIMNVTRCSADQIMRARVGVAFSAWSVAAGTKVDTFRFRLHNHIIEAGEEFVGDWLAHIAEVRKKFNVARECASTIAARLYLPPCVSYSYWMSINYLALRGMCARRMDDFEQEDTCATAYGLWAAIKKVHPYMSRFLQSSSDIAKRNKVPDSLGLKEVFGTVFRPNEERWPLPEDYVDTSINPGKTGFKFEYLRDQMGIIPPVTADYGVVDWDEFLENFGTDAELFMEDD